MNEIIKYRVELTGSKLPVCLGEFETLELAIAFRDAKMFELPEGEVLTVSEVKLLDLNIVESFYKTRPMRYLVLRFTSTPPALGDLDVSPPLSSLTCGDGVYESINEAIEVYRQESAENGNDGLRIIAYFVNQVIMGTP